MTLSRDRFRCAAANIAPRRQRVRRNAETKDLVERGDFAFDASDAFLGDLRAENAHPGDCRSHRVVGPDTVEMRASR